MLIRYAEQQFLGRTRYRIAVTDGANTFNIFRGTVQRCGGCSKYVTDMRGLARFRSLPAEDGKSINVGWDWTILGDRIRRWMVSMKLKPVIVHSEGHECPECENMLADKRQELANMILAKQKEMREEN